MRLFLDENITLKAAQLFQGYGHDVVSVQSLGLKGITDEEVFNIAQAQNRVLITHNGRDFIIQIPPRMQGVTHHEGLFWLKYQLNRINAGPICNEINIFFESIKSIANSIWIYKKPSEIVKYYP